MSDDPRNDPNVEQQPSTPPVTMADFEPHSECDEHLTDVQIKAIKNMAYWRMLLLQQQGEWSPEEEAAYLNGVMAAFFACRSAERIPSVWIFGTSKMLDTLARWKAQRQLDNGA
jgi:hypothetical protein